MSLFRIGGTATSGSGAPCFPAADRTSSSWEIELLKIPTSIVCRYETWHAEVNRTRRCGRKRTLNHTAG